MHQVSVRIVELKRSTVTDNLGNFSFAGVPAGIYKIITHQEGFSDATKTVTVAAGTVAVVDFDMKIAGLHEEVTVSGSGSAESSFESIATVGSVDSGQITSRASVGLGDILENESGVSKRSSGPGASQIGRAHV